VASNAPPPPVPPHGGAKPRLLIIEDEPDLARVVEFNFKQAGFEVRATAKGRDGLELARAEPPDAILLDLMLPDIDGAEVCRALRADPRTRGVPVIMATAKGEEGDRVTGFELGADDYVVKPFSVRELVLRVQAILRRGEVAAAAPDATGTFGVLRVDRAAHRVFVEDAELELTALEFRLLATLLERRNRVQTREALLRDVWGLHLSVETRTVDTHIKRLREKLGAAGAYIQTVRGVGYRFAGAPTEPPGSGD
jgi:two-component system phosphate regulon response regulator PhoB